MSFLTSDTANPESDMISIGAPPKRPVMTAAMALTAATYVKYSN